MGNKLKLFMVMLGCTPKGRMTEQHDIFFGIGTSLKSLVPQMIDFWPEAKGKIHLDVWREVTMVDGFKIEVVPNQNFSQSDKLFFINLGGYKENEFEEYHYKVLTVADSLAAATKKSKETTFYKHYGFKGATSHIDEKFGVDIDDIHNLSDILSSTLKKEFQLKITNDPSAPEDVFHIGYLRIEKLMKA